MRSPSKDGESRPEQDQTLPATASTAHPITHRPHVAVVEVRRLLEAQGATLKVLQCGDPSGTGEGGPGYRYKDELPTDLEPAPTDPTGARKIYPRGVLAMANAGPDTNGSQFFLVYADSALRPNYSIYGTVRHAGLATLDKVAAGGIAPTPDNPAPVDGKPALPADIIRARRTC